MASVFELYGTRDDLPRCQHCDGLGAMYERWSPSMWRPCPACLGSGSPAVRPCPTCRGWATVQHYPYYPERTERLPCERCGHWGYLLGGFLHPNLEKSKK